MLIMPLLQHRIFT